MQVLICLLHFTVLCLNFLNVHEGSNLRYNSIRNSKLPENETSRSRERNVPFSRSSAHYAVFENYQKARLYFAQSVSDLASKPNGPPVIMGLGALPLLLTLTLDVTPTVQRTAMLALGRLAHYSPEMAKQLVKKRVIHFVVNRLKPQNKQFIGSTAPLQQMYRRSATFLLRSVASHSAALAKVLVTVKALEVLNTCLKDVDPLVKESAGWVIANIAKHSEELAFKVVSDEYGLVPLLILCLSDDSLPVVRVTASVIYEISKHSQQISQVLVEHNIVSALSMTIRRPDEKLKRIVLPILTQLSRHSDELAEVVATDMHSTESAIAMLNDEDLLCAKNAAIHLLECVRHTNQLAETIVQAGGIKAAIKFILTHKENDLVPALMFLYNLATLNDEMASIIIHEKAVLTLCNVLDHSLDNAVREISVLTIGYLGCYSNVHAEAVAETDALVLVAALALKSDTPPSLRNKCYKCLKMVLEQCVHYETLEILLSYPNCEITRTIFDQYSKVIPIDAEVRKKFVSSGVLKRLLEISLHEGSAMENVLVTINLCFPSDIISMNAPKKLQQTLLAVKLYEPPLQ